MTNNVLKVLQKLINFAFQKTNMRENLLNSWI